MNNNDFFIIPDVGLLSNKKILKYKQNPYCNKDILSTKYAYP